MEDYAEVVSTFEGVHFLAALDSEDAPDEDCESWNSSISGDESGCNDDDDDDNEPKMKRLCAPISWTTTEVTLNPFPFTGESGMRFMLEQPEPIDLFNCFCRTDFLQKILESTNLYGKELGLQGQNFGLWRPLSMNELSVFIGLLFHTGTIRMNNLSDYWSSQKLFDVKIFKSSMMKDRFMRALTALRYGRHDDDIAESEKNVNALKPLGDYFNTVMESVCCPGRELVIDNCLAVKNGVILFKESVDTLFTKPELYVHSLSEPNGLIHRVVVTESSSSSYAVNALMKNKKNRGHSLFLDKNYCSIPIVHDMALHRTFCTGILRSDSKSIPQELLSAKVVKGGAPVARFSEPGICLIKWKGREEIIATSSEFGGMRDTCDGLNNGKHKPLMLREYRKTSHEIDRKEFIMSYKPMEGKNVGWYRSIIIYFLNLMLKNAYVLYNTNYKRISFHEFRLSVISSLLRKEKTVPELIPSNLALTVEDDVLHVPSKFPKRDGQRSLRKRCKVCLRDGKRTDSYYHCPRCPHQPALCLERCFAEYHSSLKIKIDSKRPSTDTENENSQ